MARKLTWREYFLREASRATKDGLPITAKQNLQNAALFKGESFDEIWERKVREGHERNGDNSPLPTTKDVK